VTFLRKLVPGAASTSYGIYCAQLAGLPESIITRAYSLLESIDGQEGGGPSNVRKPSANGRNAISAFAGMQEAAVSREPMPGQALEAHDDAAAKTKETVPAAVAIAEHTEVYTGSESVPESAAAAEISSNQSAEVVQLSIFGEAAPESNKSRRANPKAEQFADQLKRLDLFNMTPMQAMQWLNDMKLKLAEDKG
jgi:DNA mismatch repair protein MutS